MFWPSIFVPRFVSANLTLGPQCTAASIDTIVSTPVTTIGLRNDVVIFSYTVGKAYAVGTNETTGFQ